MDLLTAIKCSELVEKRDKMVTMRQIATEKEKNGWALTFDDKKMPIPSEVKSFFQKAIEDALHYYNSEIEKL